jgi:hypothetical protein
VKVNPRRASFSFNQIIPPNATHPEWILSSLSANVAVHEVRDREDCQRRPDRR